jgi:hypothetical protein
VQRCEYYVGKLKKIIKFMKKDKLIKNNSTSNFKKREIKSSLQKEYQYNSESK